MGSDLRVFVFLNPDLSASESTRQVLLISSFSKSSHIRYSPSSLYQREIIIMDISADRV